MSIICPVCGSSDIETTKQCQSLKVMYGPPATFLERIDRCKTCGECGDFADENDSKIKEATGLAMKASLENMLANLNAGGIRNAYLERSLGLPARTVARWKTGEYSASVIALLRMVYTFPWLLKIADSNYQPSFAVRTVIEEAAHLLSSIVRTPSWHRAWTEFEDQAETGSPQFPIYIQTQDQMIPPHQNGVVELLSMGEG